MEIAPRIIVDKRIRFGKPVIKGTRVPVATILDQLAAGVSHADIIREYQVGEEDIRAVLKYAAEILAREEVRAS